MNMRLVRKRPGESTLVQEGAVLHIGMRCPYAWHVLARDLVQSMGCQALIPASTWAHRWGYVLHYSKHVATLPLCVPSSPMKKPTFHKVLGCSGRMVSAAWSSKYTVRSVQH